MTVITMPSSEKKSDNVPLVTNIEIDPSVQGKDLEAGKVENNEPVVSRYLILRVVNRSFYSIWTLIYVLLMALFITFMVIYGKHIYKMIGVTINDENEMFYNSGAMPLNDNLDVPTDLDIRLSLMESQSFDQFARNMDKMKNPMDSSLIPGDPIAETKDDFSLDLKDESYEKTFPILPLASTARFIHDFSENVTGIVDGVGKRCYILPLNRDAVTPPKSLIDLLLKMSTGYYTVDINEVMRDMRVVKPEIQDLTEYGAYISKDCAGYSTYKLEKFVSGVV